MKHPFSIFTEFSNTAINNSTDYHIATCLLRKIARNEELTLEKVSEETDVSQASVSRFIRRAGFASWQEFRYKCEQAPEIISLKRKIISSEQYGKSNKGQVINKRFESVIDNIKETKDNIDIDKLERIVCELKKADRVSVVGDNQALSLFSPFQMDMLINGIPVYLYFNSEIKSMDSEFINENSICIMATTDSDFVSDSEIKLIKSALSKGSKVIVFTQSKSDIAKELGLNQKCARNILIYQYGIEKTFNDGYYSLFYLLQIISEMLYIND